MESIKKSLSNMGDSINNARSSLLGTDNQSKITSFSPKLSQTIDLDPSINKSFFQSEKPSFKSSRASMSLLDSPKQVTSFMSKTGSVIPQVIDSVKETTGSFFNFKAMLFWFLLLVLLAFIGINIFSYLGKGTDLIANLLAPITSTLGMLTGDTAKTVVKNVSDGSQKIVDATSKATQGTMDYVEKGTDASISFLQTGLNKPSIVNPENEDLETTTKLNKKSNKATKEPEEPEPARSTSLSHGYCYIGKINDTRHCAKVSARSQCMSGDIYPSMDVCVNPNLRG